MRIYRIALSLLTVIGLSALLLVLLGSGWTVLSSSTPLLAQESGLVAATTPYPASNLELVGHLGRVAQTVAVQGDYAFLGLSIDLVVLDISQPARPTVVASLPFADRLYGFAIQGDLLYIANGSAGLVVVDISDPYTPQILGAMATTGIAWNVAISGTYAYIAAADAGLQIIDVSDPATPLPVGVYNTPGRALGVDIAGGYVYVADELWSLRILDVTDPTAPVEVGSLQTDDRVYDVVVNGPYAYLANSSSGLRVVDVSDPTKPVEVGSYRSYIFAVDVVLAGNLIYLVDSVATIGTGSLEIVDVTDPTAPAKVGVYGVSPLPNAISQASAVAVAGDVAYLAAGARGLHIVDVVNPAAPVRIGTYETLNRPIELAVYEGYAYIAEGVFGLRVVDVRQPQRPVAVGAFDPPDTDYARAVAVANGYAYVVDGTSGLWAIDIRNPALPVQVDRFTPDVPQYVFVDIALSGSYAYIADTFKKLRVVDISDPTVLTEVGFYDIDAHAVAVEGGYAYVAAGTDGVRVLDVSNPANPVEVGFYTSPVGEPFLWPYAVTVDLPYVYVGGGAYGLWILDVSDPANPQKVGHYDTPGWAGDMAVLDGYVAVADNNTGVRIVDVSDPSDPVEVGFYSPPGYLDGVAVADGYLYAVTNDGHVYDNFDAGLHILHYQTTSFPAVGQVTNWNGAPLRGVELRVGPTQSGVTDSLGNYSLSGLVIGTHTITPSRPGYVFDPPSRTFSVPPLARRQDFTVSTEAVYSIRGGVYESSFPDSFPFLAPIPVHLDNGAQTTSQDGFYNFANLSPGIYAVTPTLADHSFYPSFRVLEIPPSSGQQDFVVVKDPTLNILGGVYQSNGEPFVGVEIEVTPLPTTTRALFRGAALLSTDRGISALPRTMTDAEGRYAFLNLEPGQYNVAAHLDGYRLLPASHTAELPTLNEYPFTILPGPVTGGVTGGVTTTITLTDTQGLTTLLTFPVDALAPGVEVTVTVKPLWMPAFPGYVSAHHAFDLALSPSPGRVPVLDFSQPVSVSVRYSITDTRSVSDTAAIGLWWLGEEGWQAAGQGCASSPGQSHDETAQVVHAVICQPGLYTLAGPAYQRWMPWLNQ